MIEKGSPADLFIHSGEEQKVQPQTDFGWCIFVNENLEFRLGKSPKIKLIIFAEFSANGGGEAVPPIREKD